MLRFVRFNQNQVARPKPLIACYDDTINSQLDGYLTRNGYHLSLNISCRN